MKLLNGQELADYIKERQARTVRRLLVSNIVPKLVIIHDNESPVIMKYVRLKQAYGKDIGVTVEVKKVSNDEEAREIIRSASVDNSVHGIFEKYRPQKRCRWTERRHAQCNCRSDKLAIGRI